MQSYTSQIADFASSIRLKGVPEAVIARAKGLILDGLGCGIGYTFMLVLMALVRETMGFGTLLGLRVMPETWTNWVVMTIAPGAFFLLGVYLWIFRTLARKTEQV